MMPLVAELVRDAQQNNPTLTQALARLAEARAGVRRSDAQRWPSVNALAQSQRGASAASNSGVDAKLARCGCAMGGRSVRRRRAPRSPRRRRAASRRRSAGMPRGSVWQPTWPAPTSVLRACEAQQQVLDHDASSQTQTAELTREKVRVGFEAPANGALADGAAADAGNRAIAQRAECDALVKSLVVLTGQREPALRARLQTGVAKLPQPAVFAVGALPAQLLQQRPDIAAAERALVAAAADVGVAEAARYPRLTFSGNLGTSVLRVGGSSTDGTAWGFGPSLVLPVFDGGARRANEDAARARYDEVAAILDGRLRVAINEVEDALVRLDAASRRETQLQTAAEGFRAYYAAAEQRWRIGSGSLFEREEARRIALNAHNALLAVQRERVQAWVALYRALRGGWPPADAAPEMNKK